MRELAMRAVDLAPLLGQPRIALTSPGQQPVHARRRPAPGRRARPPPAAAASRGARRSRTPEHAARAVKAPARRGRRVDQLQQRSLTRASTRAGTAPTSPSAFFPAARRARSPAPSRSPPAARSPPSPPAARHPRRRSRRPGLDCANAPSAPSRPTRRIRMIVVGSTFQRSAASRCDNSPVSSCCQIWYFSSADNDRARRLRDILSGPGMVLLLATTRPNPIVARQTRWREKTAEVGNELRRRTWSSAGSWSGSGRGNRARARRRRSADWRARCRGRA